jgi:tryptophan 2,3-dioxygenase
VLKTLVGQLDILETMTPMSFTSFRDRLDSASGFQSAQFRELEFLLGYKRPEMLKYHESNPPALAALQRRLQERSVVDHFYDFLEHRGVDIPAALRQKAPEIANEASAEVQAGLLELYRNNPEVTILLELMTDFDEGFQEWRYRHVKMVERTIGTKPGTGGSPGAAFLRSTLFKAVFPDLWAIRHLL